MSNLMYRLFYTHVYRGLSFVHLHIQVYIYIYVYIWVVLLLVNEVALWSYEEDDAQYEASAPSQFVEWDLKQKMEVFDEEHREKMEHMDMELAAEEENAERATQEWKQWNEQRDRHDEAEWYERANRFDAEDNAQEASSFHVMPNLYNYMWLSYDEGAFCMWVRFVCVGCPKENVNTMGLLCMWLAQGMCVN